MRAVVCRTVGELEDLEVAEVDAPVMRPGCVRVDVAFAGLNYVDALFVQGRYQIKPPPPFIPGNEVAGVVGAVGEGVAELAVGDRVVASVGLGGFAQQVVVPAAGVTVLPDQLGLAAAAGVTQSYSTALYALRDRAGLAAGETVLVLGAGGGVGVASVQVARALGARVIGVASTEAKRELALGAGAELVLDADPASLKDAAREAAGGGVDVVVDPVGDAFTEPALRALGNRGRLLVIGFAGGRIPSLPANQVLLRNRSVLGVDWGAWGMANPEGQAAIMAELMAMVSRGAVSPPEPSTYPLDEAPRALADLLGRRVAGKAVLAVTASAS